MSEKEIVEDMMDEFVRRGLIAEGFTEDGKQGWYIPEDKVGAVDKFIKELDRKMEK